MFSIDLRFHSSLVPEKAARSGIHEHVCPQRSLFRPASSLHKLITAEGPLRRSLARWFFGIFSSLPTAGPILRDLHVPYLPMQCNGMQRNATLNSIFFRLKTRAHDSAVQEISLAQRLGIRCSGRGGGPTPPRTARFRCRESAGSNFQRTADRVSKMIRRHGPKLFPYLSILVDSCQGGVENIFPARTRIDS